MILTLTLNPSLDRTLRIERLRSGEVNRALDTFTDPGGKGVNVARALSEHGADVVAVMPVGASTGDALTALLRETGVPYVAVPAEHRTRANVSLVESDGVTTKINEPGQPLSSREVTAVTDAVISRVQDGDWVVTAGSLAPGQDPEVYARIGRSVHAAGARWAVDTSGEALRAALNAAPDLVKPNLEELREAVGAEIESVGAVVDHCRDLIAGSGLTVLCSLGADGAVLVDRTIALAGVGPRVQVRNTVGAGDALLAGYLRGLTTGERSAGALRTGIAWATAAVATPGTGVPGADVVRPDDVLVTVADSSAAGLLEKA